MQDKTRQKTLKSGIVVLVGKLVRSNKRTGWNKRTGGNNCSLNFNLCHRMIKFQLDIFKQKYISQFQAILVEKCLKFHNFLLLKIERLFAKMIGPQNE